MFRRVFFHIATQFCRSRTGYVRAYGSFDREYSHRDLLVLYYASDLSVMLRDRFHVM